MNIYLWADTAASFVPFRKDRARVRAELIDHFDDRLEALESMGVPEFEAKKQVLAAMGDPEETGRLLRTAHNPLLGWALRAARVLLLLLVLLTVWMHFEHVFRGIDLTSRKEILEKKDCNNEGDWFRLARRTASCDDEFDYGPFRVSFDEGYFQYFEEIWKFGGSFNSYIAEIDVVLLRFTGAPWYELGLPTLRVVDDQGREWEKRDDSYYDGVETPFFCVCDPELELPWRTIVPITFHLIPKDLKWLEIWLEHPGYSEKLRVHLEPWRITTEEMPQMGDGTEIIQNLSTRLSKEITLNQSSKILAGGTTESQSAGGLEVSIPWIEESRGTKRRVACIMMIRGDVTELLKPLLNVRKWIDKLGLEVSNAMRFDASPGYMWDIFWHEDGVLLTIEWEPATESSCYELCFTAPDGESCAFSIEPDGAGRTFSIKRREEEIAP